MENHRGSVISMHLITFANVEARWLVKEEYNIKLNSSIMSDEKLTISFVVDGNTLHNCKMLKYLQK